MSKIDLIVRTADQTRKAEITLDSSETGEDIVNAAVENWSLPADTDYNLVSTSHGKTIVLNESLEKNGIQDGDILEVQPVLVAGRK